MFLGTARTAILTAMPNWTINELDKYKIRIRTVNTKSFFGISKLPAPTVDPIILQNADVSPERDAELPKDLRRFFAYLRETSQKDQPSIVDDFTRHLLGDLLRFDEPLGVTRRRISFPFIMNGKPVNAVANVSVRRGEYYIILVQRSTVNISIFPCCCASLNTYKEISRPSGASASGHCYRGIFQRQRQAH